MYQTIFATNWYIPFVIWYNMCIDIMISKWYSFYHQLCHTMQGRLILSRMVHGKITTVVILSRDRITTIVILSWAMRDRITTIVILTQSYSITLHRRVSDGQTNRQTDIHIALA